MIILTFSDYYLPGYRGGGLIRAVANTVAALGRELSFRVVAADRDLGDSEPYSGIVYGQWMPVGQAAVRYLAPSERSLRQLTRLVSRETHDVLYLNSFFSRVSLRVLLLRRLGVLPNRPLVLAPRGEFSPGAYGIRGVRKRVCVALARMFRLDAGITWQASSELESRHIQALWGGNVRTMRVVVAPELLGTCESSTPAAVSRADKRAGNVKMIFVSRIARMKNLDGALRILSQLRAPATLDIYGPIEDEAYWQECLALIASLPENVTIMHRGELPHHAVSGVLQNADLFFLPTLGENFGHVIMEALAAGCPVLVSTETPWRGLTDRGIGWDLPLDEPDRFRHAIEAVAAMSEDEHSAMRRRAAAFAASVSTDDDVLQQNRAVFESLCGSIQPGQGCTAGREPL